MAVRVSWKVVYQTWPRTPLRLRRRKMGIWVFWSLSRTRQRLKGRPKPKGRGALNITDSKRFCFPREQKLLLINWTYSHRGQTARHYRINASSCQAVELDPGLRPQPDLLLDDLVYLIVNTVG